MLVISSAQMNETESGKNYEDQIGSLFFVKKKDPYLKKDIWLFFGTTIFFFERGKTISEMDPVLLLLFSHPSRASSNGWEFIRNK